MHFKYITGVVRQMRYVTRSTGLDRCRVLLVGWLVSGSSGSQHRGARRVAYPRLRRRHTLLFFRIDAAAPIGLTCAEPSTRTPITRVQRAVNLFARMLTLYRAWPAGAWSAWSPPNSSQS